ncbi:MAG: hypothetical protein IT428_23645 [Planctomycetaceae bacterium]|nr:hypothetical protein [Planctomycetaceae bacterium]
MTVSLRSLVAALTLAVGAMFVQGTPAQAQQGEVVQFRLMSWKTAHFDSAREADSFEQSLRRLGCETRQDGHAGHIDVQYRCPRWRSMTTPTDAAAHRLQGWLRENEFETRHDH